MREQLQRRVIGLHAFRGNNLPQSFRDARDADAGKVEALAARQDRRGDFLHLGGGKNELDVRRRLLERLEQRVERVLHIPRGQHVDFVDDVDLVARPGRAILGILPQVAHVVDAVVARPVDLLDVEILAGRNCPADFAFAARRGGRPVDAVQRLGEDAGSAGLADAARPGEEIGVRHPAALDGVAERLRDRLLADQLAELLRPIAACKDRVVRRRRRRGSRRFSDVSG